LIILMADWLLQHMMVGPLGGKPRSDMIARTYRACFAVATAARNSASVELVAVIDCVLHLSIDLRFGDDHSQETCSRVFIDRRHLNMELILAKVQHIDGSLCQRIVDACKQLALLLCTACDRSGAKHSGSMN